MQPQHTANDLYFVAVLPDASVSDEVTRFKEYAASEFDSRHALRSPPHVTLFPPFRWDRHELRRLGESLRRFASAESPFDMELNGFDCFPPRVIFVDIVENEPLAAMQRRLVKHLKETAGLESGDDRPYHPHMTVAFKDLRRSVFPSAWAYFSGLAFYRRFKVSALTLLHHRDGRWELAGDFSFAGKDT